MSVDALGTAATELYELVPDGVIVVSADGLIAYVSSRAEAMLGYPRNSLVGESIETLIPDASHTAHRDSRSQFVAHPAARSMGSGLELVALCRDGSEIPVEVSLAPWKSDDGLVVVAAIRDRSELRNIANELRNSRERLQSLIRSVPDTAIFSLDEAGVISDWNYGATLVTGLAGHEAVGNSLDLMLTRRNEANDIASALTDEAERSGIAVHQGWLLRGDGARYFAEVSVSAFSDGGSDTTAFAVTIRDITEFVLGAARLASVSAFSELQPAANGLEPLYRLLVQLVDDVLAPQFASLTINDESHPIELVVGDRTAAEMAVEGDSNSEMTGAISEVDLRSGGDEIGTLRVGLMPDATAYTRAEREYLLEVVAALGAAIGRRQAQDDRSRLAILEDHDRIARDLHDTVIQQIFAAGLRLQAASARIVDAPARDEVGQVVDELDSCIRTLRQTIYRLENEDAEFELRRRVLELVSKSAMSLGLMPAVAFDNSDRESVPAKAAEDALKSLGELLSNVAKHADARRVEVHVTISESLSIVVTDDGVGIADNPSTVGFGLRNLATRAQLHGGSFKWERLTEGGTRMVWTVPAAP